MASSVRGADFQLLQAVRASAQPLTGFSDDLDALVERIGEARFVLCGEASHGTEEFYSQRARLTRRLIENYAHLLPPQADGDTAAPDPRLAALTSREREVLQAIARGWTNSEIADRLNLAESTVKTHVGRVLAKIDARDRVQAVIFAYDTRLVLPA